MTHIGLIQALPFPIGSNPYRIRHLINDSTDHSCYGGKGSNLEINGTACIDKSQYCLWVRWRETDRTRELNQGLISDESYDKAIFHQLY